jgi:hypothetical protein
MGATSEHFSNSELACHGTTCGPDGTGCRLNECKPELLDALEQFRTLVGKPVIIDDAYRDPVHNAQIGGVPNSEHVQGIAADIRVEGMSGAELEAAAMKCSLITAIGRSDNPPYIHIDTRAVTQGRVLWAYDANGKWTHYFPPGANV